MNAEEFDSIFYPDSWSTQSPRVQATKKNVYDVDNSASLQGHVHNSSSAEVRHFPYYLSSGTTGNENCVTQTHHPSLSFTPTAAPVLPLHSTYIASDHNTPSSVDPKPSFGTGFTLPQVPAVQAILQFTQMSPGVPIPSSLITDRLVEVSEGRGYCLIGNCGSERAVMKATPDYNDSTDKSRKRLDHLYDHVRDIHFGCRPFQCGKCTRSFSREHDLKRHDLTHPPVPMACPYPNCPRVYTREDNLKRHIAQKHPGYVATMGPISHSAL